MGKVNAPATGRRLIVAGQLVNRNQGLLVKVAKPRLKVRIINGLNEIERNFRLRDFMVRCTLGPCPLISSLRNKTNEFALFER